jgi:hypothetical protein
LQLSPSPTALFAPQQSFFGLTNLSSVVRILEKENDRLTKEVSAIAATRLLARHTESRISTAGRAKIAAARNIAENGNANLTQIFRASAMAILDQLTSGFALWPLAVTAHQQ